MNASLSFALPVVVLSGKHNDWGWQTQRLSLQTRLRITASYVELCSQCSAGECTVFYASSRIKLIKRPHSIFFSGVQTRRRQPWLHFAAAPCLQPRWHGVRGDARMHTQSASLPWTSRVGCVWCTLSLVLFKRHEVWVCYCWATIMSVCHRLLPPLAEIDRGGVASFDCSRKHTKWSRLLPFGFNENACNYLTGLWVNATCEQVLNCLPLSSWQLISDKRRTPEVMVQYMGQQAA